MHARRRELVACGLALCLVGAQLLIKPQPDTREARAAAERARRTRPWQARTAPGFELALRDGGAFRLSDETGRRIVILNFFTTSSEPCTRDLAELHRHVQQLQRQGHPVVAVAINVQESAEIVDRYVNTLHIAMPIAIDASGGVARAYEVTRFPTTVVMGANGHVVLYHPDEIGNAASVFDTMLDAEFAALAHVVPVKAR